MRQVEFEDRGVTVTRSEKVDHCVSQMVACNLFEEKFLDDFEESNNKSWGATQPHFTKQYAKERYKLERNKSHKNYNRSTAFQELPHPHAIETLHGGSTATTADNSFTAGMKYASALEEKSNKQANRMIKLEARVDGQTILTKATNFATSTVTTGWANKDLKELQAMMK